jgi:hypothetical protein
MTSQGLFAGEFPADVLPTQLRELLKEAAPALLDGLFEDLRAIESALSGGDGAAPTCTAEELIWHLLLQEAIVTYESQELSADRRSDLADYVARFEDFIYQDTDWRLLYDHSEAERDAAANHVTRRPGHHPAGRMVQILLRGPRSPGSLLPRLMPGPVDLVTGRPT